MFDLKTMNAESFKALKDAVAAEESRRMSLERLFQASYQYATLETVQRDIQVLRSRLSNVDNVDDRIQVEVLTRKAAELFNEL